MSKSYIDLMPRKQLINDFLINLTETTSIPYKK